MDGISKNIVVLQKSLDLVWYRQQVTLNNIANSDTPGYKSKNVEFETLLKTAISGSGKTEKGIVEGIKKFWDCKVLATDISSKVLEEAICGVYEQDKIAPLPAYWKMNYFQRCGEGEYCVTEAVKKEVIYRKFNLMETQFPFKKKFHCIFCRNVMMYFDEPTKDELVSRLYDCTELGGYLFVGHSEVLNRETTKYKYIMPAVYRKI